jgi:hypothetical protein
MTQGSDVRTRRILASAEPARVYDDELVTLKADATVRISRSQERPPRGLPEAALNHLAAREVASPPSRSGPRPSGRTLGRANGQSSPGRPCLGAPLMLRTMTTRRI